ncbi:glycoside hydrolase family protein [Chitinophaga deserti]|uniref:hypothetical protein n=1 Tax=Chitinophaga deserti TaxID=2164099 RepID=UPI0013003DFD|nr:hypothetical protein [Chitinophaga deserti]
MRLFVLMMCLMWSAAAMADPITPNDFRKGTDSERIEAAIREALRTGVNAIEIPRWNQQRKAAEWLIDRAILVPSDFTLVLNDCLVRLSPGTADNIITNAGARTQPLSANRNVRITGKGNAVLSGGLEAHFNPPGDKSGYRTIGILLYDTQHFTIEGFTMEETQAWAISMEHGCAYGRVANINFANTNKFPNQDGVDVRKGCHDIVIENITGVTGDDVIALTGLATPNDTARTSMQVGGRLPRNNDDIYNIIIRNVQAKCIGGHALVRLLNQDGIKMYNITVSGIFDTSTEEDIRPATGIRIGEEHYWSSRMNVLGETYNIKVDNVHTRAKTAVKVVGTLKDATFTNITSYGGISQLVEFGRQPVEGVRIEAQKL